MSYEVFVKLNNVVKVFIVHFIDIHRETSNINVRNQEITEILSFIRDL